MAPLASLLFQTPPLKADVWALSAYFFSFYIASAMVMRPVSRGSRNPFWSDIYEIAMCFSLSAVALKTLATPRKERPFEVTPKGQRVKKNTATELSLAWPLLLTFALLIVGLVWGIQHWRQGTGDPGLPVSLFWGSVNLLFVTVALFVASEQAQSRRMFRLNRDFAGEILIDGDTVPARVTNISERGAALVVDRPLYSTQTSMTLLLTAARGAIIQLNGAIVRQTPLPSGQIDIGLLFTDLTPLATRALIEKMFGDSVPWQAGDRFRPGIASSVRSLLQALSVPWRRYVWNQRRMLRLRTHTPCRLNTGNRILTGHVTDISFTGVSAVFRRSPTASLAECLLELPQVTLKVRPVAIVHRWNKTVVRFRVDSIERGEPRWREWHESEWQQQRLEGTPAHA